MTLLSFCLLSSVQVLPLDMTTPHDSYTWNYRELVTLLTLSESLTEGGFVPLTIRSMRKNLTRAIQTLRMTTSVQHNASHVHQLSKFYCKTTNGVYFEISLHFHCFFFHTCQMRNLKTLPHSCFLIVNFSVSNDSAYFKKMPSVLSAAYLN